MRLVMATNINKSISIDYLAENENNAPNRVGDRIRKCRIEKGISQVELGEKVGLNGDRVQKYENGYRRPKIDLIKSFAEALDVQGIALTDPIVTTPVGAMYALFEMEELYGIQIEKNQNKVSISFGDGTSSVLSEYLQLWYERKKLFEEEMSSATEAEQKKLIKAYHLWERNFPMPGSDDSSKKLRKAQLEDKIQALQDELKKMDEE